MKSIFTLLVLILPIGVFAQDMSKEEQAIFYTLTCGSKTEVDTLNTAMPSQPGYPSVLELRDQFQNFIKDTGKLSVEIEQSIQQGPWAMMGVGILCAALTATEEQSLQSCQDNNGQPLDIKPALTICKDFLKKFK